MGLYWVAMHKETSEWLGELGVSELARRVEELSRLCDGLREENNALRARQSVLLAERAQLIDRNNLARNRVESVIARLKNMEHEG